MAVAIAHRRQRLIDLATTATASPDCPQDLKAALSDWLNVRDDKSQSDSLGKKAIEVLKKYPGIDGVAELLDGADLFAKKSVWIMGGDGWA